MIEGRMSGGAGRATTYRKSAARSMRDEKQAATTELCQLTTGKQSPTLFVLVPKMNTSACRCRGSNAAANGPVCLDVGCHEERCSYDVRARPRIFIGIIAPFYLLSSEHCLMSSNAFRVCFNRRSLIAKEFRTRSASSSRRAG